MNEYYKAVELAKKMDGMSPPHMISALAAGINDAYRTGVAVGRAEMSEHADRLAGEVLELRAQITALTGRISKAAE